MERKFEFKTTPFPHQLEEWELTRDAPTRALLWEQGCVDAETEVLTDRGWVKAPDVTSRTRIAAWSPVDRTINFEYPRRTDVLAADTLIEIHAPRRTHQMLAPAHRMPYLPSDPASLGGAAPVILAQDLYESTRKDVPALPLTFVGGGVARLSEQEKQNEWQLKFMLFHAILGKPFSLGYPPMKFTRLDLGMAYLPQVIWVKVKEILERARVTYNYSWVEDRGEWFVEYRLESRFSTLPKAFYRMSSENLALSWNTALGLSSRVTKNTTAVVVRGKAVADFLQFAGASLGIEVCSTQHSGSRWELSPKRAPTLGLRSYSVESVPNPSGVVYALGVSTGFVVYRRDGFIFPSGNCGKSKPTVDTANYLYLNGLIDGVIVLAPNGVHRNWIEGEVPDHTPDSIASEVFGVAFSTEKAGTKKHAAMIEELLKHRGLAWLAMSYEAFSTPKGHDAVADFLHRRKVLYVADEAHRIKSPTSKRVKSIVTSAKYARFRRILTGTPIAVGPFDLYTQMRFLDGAFWARHGLSSFTEFKHHFGVHEKGWNPVAEKEFDLLIGYRRLDELNAVLMTAASRKTKAEVLPFLPPKSYRRCIFPMTQEQTRMYQELSEEFQTWVRSLGDSIAPAGHQADMFCTVCHGVGEVEEDGYIYPCPSCGHGNAPTNIEGIPVFASLAIVRISMLQQITSGFVPVKEEGVDPIQTIPGENPRLLALMEELGDVPHPVIIWARYRREIDQICGELTAAGITFGRYDGAVDESGRSETKARFQGWRALYDKSGAMIGREDVAPEDRVKVFVGNPAAGSTGLTLTAARKVIYYSNSFKLIDRLQSEDRAHRIGQTHPVEYVDLEAENTVDRKIVFNLLQKYDIAASITGDTLTEWIS